MKTAICSNDEEARYYLETILLTYHKAKAFEFEAFEFATGDEVLSSPVVFDLVFLDIDTDNIRENNIEKRILDKDENTTIIYIKEQSEFLKRAYPKSAIYTMPKPVEPKEVFALLDRYFYFETKRQLRNLLVLKNAKKSLTFYAEDMLFFEKKGISKVKTVSHLDSIVLKGSVKGCHQAAVTAGFIAISSKVMVNPRYVQGITKAHVVMTSGEKLTLSKKNAEPFFEALNDFYQSQILPIDILLGQSRIKPASAE